MSETRPSFPEPLLDEAADWLVRLNEPAASQADFEEWQKWLSLDPQNAGAFQALEGTWRLSVQAAVAHYSVSGGAHDGYRPEEPVTAWVRRRRTVWWWRTVGAASVVLAVLGGLSAWQLHRPAVIQTAVAEQRVVWLSDRSRVTVGPRTRVSYRYGAWTRAVALDDGQAFFEVAKDTQRPFVVQTRRGRIVAVGTAFSVDVTADRLNVSVAEGTVRIEDVDTAQGQGTGNKGTGLEITAGRRYVSANRVGQLSTLPAPSSSESWREGRLAYYGDPLSAVIADLNRYTSDQIELADPQLGELKYTGTVFPENMNDWLTSLPDAFPLRVERRAHGWMIVRRTP